MFAIVVSILYLALLECLLSVDNAIALAALVHGRLSDPKDRDHALKWGIVGAYLIRFTVIWAGLWLLAHPWVKAMAGGYLIYMAAKELFFKGSEDDAAKPGLSSTLWRTIVAVEVMDLMFSVDSIAVTLSVSDKFIVLAGGAVIGIALMRFAAGKVITFIDRFPVLQTVAFVLVGMAGARVLVELAGVVVPETAFAGVMLLIVAGSLMLPSAKEGK